jgi:hypothetical protein
MLEVNRKRFKVLKISMWVTVAFWATIYTLFTLSEDVSSRFAPIAILVGVINSWIFLIYLGKLVAAAGKSVVLWILGTLMFSVMGVGPVVAYLRMKSIAVHNDWD